MAVAQDSIDRDEFETPQQPLYADRVKVYPQRVGGLFRRIKWAVLDRPAGDLLSRAVAALGSRAERAEPGHPGRHAGTARLFLLDRDLAAGGLLPRRPADSRSHRAVLRDLARRPRVVRLHLPADRLDRSLHVGRARHRGRPQQAHEARPGADVGREGGQEDRQAPGLAGSSPSSPAAPGSCISTMRRPWWPTSSPARPA